MARNSIPQHLLVSIPASHYCEKVRWALELHGVSYTESKWPPVLHYLATKPRGGSSVPLLVAPSGTVFTDSTDILCYLNALGLGVVDLYPQEPELKASVRQLEDWFDEKLGKLVRLVVYHHTAFASDDAALDLLSRRQDGMELWKRLLFRVCFIPIRALMKAGMRINAEGAAAALPKIGRIFEKVGAMLSDGRNYLVGGRLTAADITFASLAAPLLCPPGYGAWVPTLAELPPGHPSHQLVATPAGKFALELYRKHRQPQPEAGIAQKL